MQPQTPADKVKHVKRAWLWGYFSLGSWWWLLNFFLKSVKVEGEIFTVPWIDNFEVTCVCFVYDGKAYYKIFTAKSYKIIYTKVSQSCGYILLTVKQGSLTKTTPTAMTPLTTKILHCI